MLNDKTLKLDNILNEILKKVTYIIKNDLAHTVSKYFINKITSEIFCKSIIVILRKKRKKDYLLLSSYCLIALKNIIAKLIKKIVAQQIIDATEMHSFLL